MKKYPFDKQEDSKDCGATCLSMIIRYYGGYLCMEEIRQLVNISRDGTTAYHICEGAKKIGFDAIGFKCELANFKNEKIIFPIIANVIVNQSYTHFIVIYDINYRKKELIIADPADKIKKISFDSFNLIYSGVILVLYPKQKLPFVEKTKITINDFKSLFAGNKKFLVSIFFLSCFVIIYSLLLSFYSQIMIDSLSNRTNYLSIIFIMFLVVNIIKITSEYFKNIVFTYITQKIELLITMDSFEKILSLPYCYYRNHNTGDVLSRVKDISLIRDTISRWIIVLIVEIPLMIISFIILYSINAKLSLISLCIFLLYWFILKVFHHPLEEIIGKCHKDNSALTSYQIESINSFETIKGLGIKEKVKNKVEKLENIFLHSLLKYQKTYLLENYLKELIQGIGYLVIFYFGCCLVRDEMITLGVLFTFQNLLSYFLTPVRELVDLDADTKNMKKAFIRLKELFKTEENIGYITARTIGDINLKNLNYSYRLDYEVLKNVNLKIKKGEKVLLLGKSGSGKSTLLKLLKRYYAVDRGHVEIGNIDINDYKNLNDILYINQMEFLFTDSLYNNVTLGEEINGKKLEEIFKLCEIDEIVKKSNLGYFLLIDENGFNLSGGERQRIILARSLLKPFNILIIDEGLSQVDTDMERRILKRLFKKFYDKTIFVISHRLDNSDLFNRHIELDKGTILKDVVRNGQYRHIS